MYIQLNYNHTNATYSGYLSDRHIVYEIPSNFKEVDETFTAKKFDDFINMDIIKTFDKSRLNLIAINEAISFPRKDLAKYNYLKTSLKAPEILIEKDEDLIDFIDKLKLRVYIEVDSTIMSMFKGTSIELVGSSITATYDVTRPKTPINKMYASASYKNEELDLDAVKRLDTQIMCYSDFLLNLESTNNIEIPIEFVEKFLFEGAILDTITLAYLSGVDVQLNKIAFAILYPFLLRDRNNRNTRKISTLYDKIQVLGEISRECIYTETSVKTLILNLGSLTRIKNMVSTEKDKEFLTTILEKIKLKLDSITENTLKI